LTVTQPKLYTDRIATTLSKSKSIKPSLLEDLISSKNECVSILDLKDLPIQIRFEEWWTSINLDLKVSIASNNSGLAPSWRFYLHYGIEQTGSPGIICIICHQVLSHPSEHGTSSMGKQFLAQAHITKLNKITESEKC
jgi:hypothetical protein